MSDRDSLVFTAKWNRGVKVLTFVSCGVVFVSCLLQDWDEHFGPNVLSGVRPAVRSLISSMYGAQRVTSSQSQQGAQQQQQEAPCKTC